MNLKMPRLLSLHETISKILIAKEIQVELELSASQLTNVVKFCTTKVKYYITMEMTNSNMSTMKKEKSNLTLNQI